MKKSGVLIYTFPLLIFLLSSCTFDYGEVNSDENSLPDLVMENVEYVRVRASDPIARIQAERAERYERQRIMRLMNFSFEQYGERGNEVNLTGDAGNAQFDIDSGDIFMNKGVKLEVESEDVTIETEQLDWKDKTRILSSGGDYEVNIYQEKGTSFTGINLEVDARRRTWEFKGASGGTYVFDDTEEGADQEGANE